MTALSLYGPSADAAIFNIRMRWMQSGHRHLARLPRRRGSCGGSGCDLHAL